MYFFNPTGPELKGKGCHRRDPGAPGVQLQLQVLRDRQRFPARQRRRQLQVSSSPWLTDIRSFLFDQPDIPLAFFPNFDYATYSAGLF